MSDDTVETTWRHVRSGMIVVIRGQLYKVIARDEHRTVLADRAGTEHVGPTRPDRAVTVRLPIERPVPLADAVTLVMNTLGGTVIHG